jgi:hypothetical protein
MPGVLAGKSRVLRVTRTQSRDITISSQPYSFFIYDFHFSAGMLVTLPDVTKTSIWSSVKCGFARLASAWIFSSSGVIDEEGPCLHATEIELPARERPSQGPSSSRAR